MIKILAGETHYLGTDGKVRLSAVDWYRLHNPLSNLAKAYKDIDVTFIQRIHDKNNNEITAWENIGKKYDIFYTSYIDTPRAYSYIKAISQKFGIKHVMDLDDNLFEVDPMNPVYIRYYPGSKDLQNATTIIKDSQYVSVSTPYLQRIVNNVRGTNDVFLSPNYMDPDAFVYNRERVPDNGDKIYIGYQGSSTHYTDLFQTGVMDAIRRIMLENPNVYFYIIGMGVDDLYNHLPKDRVIIEGGERDHNKYRIKWQSLPIDIGIAPLIDSNFNRGKSSIKYYEYSTRKIPGVYSFTESYYNVVKEHDTGYLALNTLDWYNKLSRLVNDKQLRNNIANNARQDVLENYCIQDHLEPIYKFIKRVADD